MQNPSFGEWVKERRRALKLTQIELADQVGCSLETIQKLETGKRRPSKQMAELLARHLQISPDEHERFLALAKGAGEAGTDWLFSRPSLTNLPAQLTRLIGRDEAAAEVREYLLRDGVRLLTLTGAPGIGKTSLAIAVAAQLLDRFPDGVYFVALAPITDPELVPVEIGQALGLKETGNRPAMDGLLQALRYKKVLLALDNFEQIVSGGIAVARLLEGCPQLKVLVTSRESLHLKGERQYRVQPLSLPDMARLPSPEVLSANPSVALFVENAQAVDPAFSLTPENADAVAAICVGLDGLPLAIELVAARIRVLSPQALLDRLGNRLALLTGGARNLPARQQALRQAIDWSYDLLNQKEQALFRRLGVFSGGCTLSAIEAICQLGVGEDKANPQSLDMLELVGSLLDKSLLKQEQKRGQDGRFSMLETILEYSRWQLQESGEEELVRRLHAEYYLALAEASDPRTAGRDLKKWLDRLESEHDNLRAAVQWSRTSGDSWLGLRLVTALGFFWEVRGFYSEGRAWLSDALERDRDPGRAREYLLLQARALLLLGRLVVSQDDYPQGRHLFEQVLATGNDMDDPVTQAYGLCHIGWADVLMRKYAQARPLIERGLALFEASDEIWGPIEAHNFKGMCAEGEGRYDDAAQAFNESAGLSVAAGDPWQEGLALLLGGELALLQKEYDRAGPPLERALAAGRELGDKWMVEDALLGLSYALLAEGKSDEAVPLLQEALVLSDSLGYPRGIGGALARLAWAAGLQRQFQAMARLLGAAIVTLEEKQITMSNFLADHIDPLEEIGRQEIGSATWDKEFSRGRAVGLRESISFALSEAFG